MRTDQRGVCQFATQRAIKSSQAVKSHAHRGLLRFGKRPVVTSSSNESSLRIMSGVNKALCKSRNLSKAEASGPSMRRPSTITEGSEERATSTIRKRSSRNESNSLWCSGSEEVHRAIHHQMPLPDIGALSACPPQFPIFALPLSEEEADVGPYDAMSLPDQRSGISTLYLGEEQVFSRASYEASHASDGSFASNSSFPSCLQEDTETFRPSLRIPWFNHYSKDASSDSIQFHTLPYRSETSDPEESTRLNVDQPATTEPSVTVDTRLVNATGLSNVGSTGTSKLPSLGLSWFPEPPTHFLGRVTDRSQSSSTLMARSDAAGANKRTLKGKPRSDSPTFRRMPPQQYMHNAQSRSPSLIG